MRMSWPFANLKKGIKTYFWSGRRKKFSSCDWTDVSLTICLTEIAQNTRNGGLLSK